MQDMVTRFELRPSRTVAIWITVVHVGAVFAVWASAVPTPAAGVLSIVAGCGFVHGLRLHALRCATNSVAWVEIGRVLRIGFAGGRACTARLRTSPVIHGWLIILRLETDEGRANVLVPPDSLHLRADHKAIRRRIRHGAQG